MNLQMPFSVWDLLASVAAQVPVVFGTFWTALTPGTKLALVALLVIAFFLPSSPGRSPATYRRQRRRWKRRWNY